jgi:hypothetical protein
MPELTPTGAVDVVQRQVRRVRRRKNRYELQRAFYLTIAAAAVATTILLPMALLASTDVFSIAVWSVGAILMGLALVVVGSTRRRWLPRAGTLAWVEDHGALGGRVRTLLEVAARPGAKPGFFHGLLVEQIGRDLDGWTPRRLVPRAIPRGAFACAVVAALVLAVVLRLASLALPSAPTVAFSDGPLPGGAPNAGEQRREPGPGERIVAAPGVPEARGPAAPGTGDGDADDDSKLTQLSSALQESVRRQVWGKAWERVRDALARAATQRDGDQGTPASEMDADVDAETGEDWEVARAPSGELVRRRRPGVGRQPTERGDDGGQKDESTPPESPPTKERDPSEGGDGGAGAGNGVAPDLFGGTPADRDGDASFELSLAARMRSNGGRDKSASGPPPEAAPDARPVLAGDQRRETAAHRMMVPASYESVVREVFAHRDADGAAR